MEKCNIAYLVSLKCEERNHCNSNSLLWQRCWWLCTCCGEYEATRTCERLKTLGTDRISFIPLTEQLCQQRTFLQNI